MRTERSEVPQAINRIDSATADIGQRRRQGQIVAVEAAEQGDTAECSFALWDRVRVSAGGSRREPLTPALSQGERELVSTHPSAS
jgi:hypothetical protein